MLSHVSLDSSTPPAPARGMRSEAPSASPRTPATPSSMRQQADSRGGRGPHASARRGMRARWRSWALSCVLLAGTRGAAQALPTECVRSAVWATCDRQHYSATLRSRGGAVACTASAYFWLRWRHSHAADCVGACVCTCSLGRCVTMNTPWYRTSNLLIASMLGAGVLSLPEAIAGTLATRLCVLAPKIS
eukprot:scaffold3577_cov414-Prasinococcus_capsulatus_cf.AAC.8